MGFLSLLKTESDQSHLRIFFPSFFSTFKKESEFAFYFFLKRKCVGAYKYVCTLTNFGGRTCKVAL